MTPLPTFRPRSSLLLWGLLIVLGLGPGPILHSSQRQPVRKKATVVGVQAFSTTQGSHHRPGSRDAVIRFSALSQTCAAWIPTTTPTSPSFFSWSTLSSSSPPPWARSLPSLSWMTLCWPASWWPPGENGRSGTTRNRTGPPASTRAAAASAGETWPEPEDHQSKTPTPPLSAAGEDALLNDRTPDVVSSPSASSPFAFTPEEVMVTSLPSSAWQPNPPGSEEQHPDEPEDHPAASSALTTTTPLTWTWPATDIPASSVLLYQQQLQQEQGHDDDGSLSTRSGAADKIMTLSSSSAELVASSDPGWDLSYEEARDSDHADSPAPVLMVESSLSSSSTESLVASRTEEETTVSFSTIPTTEGNGSILDSHLAAAASILSVAMIDEPVNDDPDEKEINLVSVMEASSLTTTGLGPTRVTDVDDVMYSDFLVSSDPMPLESTAGPVLGGADQLIPAASVPMVSPPLSWREEIFSMGTEETAWPITATATTGSILMEASMIYPPSLTEDLMSMVNMAAAAAVDEPVNEENGRASEPLIPTRSEVSTVTNMEEDFNILSLIWDKIVEEEEQGLLVKYLDQSDPLAMPGRYFQPQGRLGVQVEGRTTASTKREAVGGSLFARNKDSGRGSFSVHGKSTLGGGGGGGYNNRNNDNQNDKKNGKKSNNNNDSKASTKPSQMAWADYLAVDQIGSGFKREWAQELDRGRRFLAQLEAGDKVRAAKEAARMESALSRAERAAAADSALISFEVQPGCSPTSIQGSFLASAALSVMMFHPPQLWAVATFGLVGGGLSITRGSLGNSARAVGDATWRFAAASFKTMEVIEEAFEWVPLLGNATEAIKKASWSAVDYVAERTNEWLEWGLKQEAIRVSRRIEARNERTRRRLMASRFRMEAKVREERKYQLARQQRIRFMQAYFEQRLLAKRVGENAQSVARRNIQAFRLTLEANERKVREKQRDEMFHRQLLEMQFTMSKRRQEWNAAIAAEKRRAERAQREIERKRREEEALAEKRREEEKALAEKVRQEEELAFAKLREEIKHKLVTSYPRDVEDISGPPEIITNNERRAKHTVVERLAILLLASSNSLVKQNGESNVAPTSKTSRLSA